MLEQILIPKFWYQLIQYGLALSVSFWLISRAVWLFVTSCFYLRAFRFNPWKISLAVLREATSVCNSKYNVQNPPRKFSTQILDPNPGVAVFSDGEKLIRIAAVLVLVTLVCLFVGSIMSH